MYQQQTSQPGVVTARTSKAACGALVLGTLSVIAFVAACIFLGLASRNGMPPDEGATEDWYYLKARKDDKTKAYRAAGITLLVLFVLLLVITAVLTRLYCKKANAFDISTRTHTALLPNAGPSGSGPTLTGYTPDTGEDGEPPSYHWSIEHLNTETSQTTLTSHSEQLTRDSETDSGYPAEEHPEYSRRNPEHQQSNAEYGEVREERAEPSAPPEPPPSYSDIAAGYIG